MFTIGLLAFLVKPYPRSVFIVPVLWGFVGSQAAFVFGVQADLGLIVAGVLGLVMIWKSSDSKLASSKVASLTARQPSQTRPTHPNEPETKTN